MSTAFSRRAFLKYTAVAAVAVAGTSLLGGCSGSETPPSTTIGSGSTALKVKTTLTSVDFKAEGDNATATFTLHIYNGRRNDIQVNNSNFYAYADATPYTSGQLTVALKEGSASGPQIDHGKEADYIVSMQVPANVEKLTLVFMPDVQYNEYASTWVLSRDQFVKSDSTGTEEQPSEDQGV